eukprot:TRINITY_DN8814_c0_g1_i1.p1 TRINITY_DN8814_c0_g1~~TRINITY_DN8814_c0_g1_i1.p1  ORF type:complete len:178 (-),score=44.74 TRINITY_DN8814_c0_g1_i1:170-703(-)
MGNCPCCPRRKKNYDPYIYEDDEYQDSRSSSYQPPSPKVSHGSTHSSTQSNSTTSTYTPYNNAAIITDQSSSPTHSSHHPPPTSRHTPPPAQYNESAFLKNINTQDSLMNDSMIDSNVFSQYVNNNRNSDLTDSSSFPSTAQSSMVGTRSSFNAGDSIYADASSFMGSDSTGPFKKP